MWQAETEATSVRFGKFQLDLETGELKKGGVQVPLQREPGRLLSVLVKKAGKVVTRSELHEHLWSASTHVEFDHCLNTAINKLRKALGETAYGRRFIETVHGLGYRFVPSPHWVLPSASCLLVAVLPFKCLGQDPDQTYFCDGLTEEVISQLGQASPQHLNVIARTSAGLYEKSRKSIGQIAQELGVSLILEGSVRREQQRIRVSARLIDATRQTQVWAASYDGEMGSILSLEIQIAEAIVQETCRALDLPGGESQPLKDRRNPQVYESYLKGRYHLQKLTRSSLVKAIGLFEQAIRDDREFALAYASLAESCNLLQFVGTPSEELGSRAKKAALRALELEERLAAAHNALAGVLLFYEWEWSRAEEEFQESLGLNPSLAEAHQNYAILLSVLGRHEEALEEAEIALKLDPVSLVANTNLAWRFYRARRYQDAAHQAKEVLEFEGTFGNAKWCLGKSLVRMGALAEGVRELEEAVQLSPRNALFKADLINAYVLNGSQREGHEHLSSLNDASRNDYVSPYALAVAHSAADHAEEALEWLQKAYQQRDPHLIWAREDVCFDRLRGQAKFRKLIQKMDYPPARA